MAKRFTDTEKWKKPFLRNMPTSYKLLWLYICDDCDHSGIWQVDIDVAKIKIGEEINQQEAVKYLGNKIFVFDGGNKWFIPSFIEFQYPSGLSEKNNAHVGIIKNLDKYNLLSNKNEPLMSPSQGAKEMVMDKDMDMVMDKDFGKSENLLNNNSLISVVCRNWYNKFPTYTKDQDQDYKAVNNIVQFMVRQHSIIDINLESELIITTMEQIAAEVEKAPFWANKPLKSIANNIQEFYNNIKNPKNVKNNGFTREGLQAAFDARFADQK